MKAFIGFLSILVLSLTSTWVVSGSTIPNPESYKVTGLAKYGAKGIIPRPPPLCNYIHCTFH